MSRFLVSGRSFILRKSDEIVVEHGRLLVLNVLVCAGGMVAINRVAIAFFNG